MNNGLREDCITLKQKTGINIILRIVSRSCCPFISCCLLKSVSKYLLIGFLKPFKLTNTFIKLILVNKKATLSKHQIQRLSRLYLSIRLARQWTWDPLRNNCFSHIHSRHKLLLQGLGSYNLWMDYHIINFCQCESMTRRYRSCTSAYFQAHTTFQLLSSIGEENLSSFFFLSKFHLNQLLFKLENQSEYGNLSMRYSHLSLRTPSQRDVIRDVIICSN